MQNFQRTIYATYNQSCMALGKPINYFPYTTLNEKFNVALNKTPPVNQYPVIKYAVIGNGGHRISGTGNNIIPTPAQHSSTDAALFNHLPFVLRTPDNDLTIDQVANYRLRANVTFNNTPYIAYYAKLLDLSNTTPTILSRTLENGNMISTPFSAGVNQLTPTPIDLNVNVPNIVNNSLVSSTSIVDLKLTADDVNEFINACSIIYGDVAYSIISEIGICSGIDITQEGTLSGNPVSYTEAVGVQINTFNEAFFPMLYMNDGLSMSYDVGATEPLLNLTS